MAPDVETPGTILVPRSPLTVSGPAALVIAGVIVAHSALVTSLRPASVPLIWFGALLSICAVLLRIRAPRQIEGIVAVGPDAIRFNGRVLVERSAITDAGLRIEDGVFVVDIRCRERTDSIIVPSEAAARRLLAAMRRERARTTVAFEVRSPRAEWFFIPATVIFLAIWGLLLPHVQDEAVRFLVVLLPVLLTLAGWAAAVSQRLVIGSDALVVSSRLRHRVIPLRDVVDAREHNDRWGNTHLRIATTTAQLVLAMPGENADHVALQIRLAVDDWSHARVGEPAEPLARGARSAANWLVAARAVGLGAASDHRTPPISTERLESIVADPGQSADARAGAAVALAAAAPETARASLMTVAKVTAMPELRRVFEQLAAGQADDEALVRELENLGEGKGAAHRR